MSESPYKPPSVESMAPATTGAGVEREKMRAVAKYQRCVIFALLANIVANVLAFGAGQSTVLAIFVIVFSLVVAIFAVVSIFFLAKELMNAGLGVLCALLMFVPCISLITLLIVNQKATSYLQANGVKVGFLGVSPDRI